MEHTGNILQLHTKEEDRQKRWKVHVQLKNHLLIWRCVKESHMLQTKISLVAFYNSNQILLKRAVNSN